MKGIKTISKRILLLLISGVVLIAFNSCYESGENYSATNDAVDAEVTADVATSNEPENTTEAVTTTTNEVTTTTEATTEKTTEATTKATTKSTTKKATTEAKTKATTTEATTKATTKATTEAEEYEDMVWISENGKKYHSKPSCSNMKDPWQISKSSAERQGYGPCKRCH